MPHAALTDPRIMPIPTVSDVNRIAAMADPVARNHEITRCYYELSRELVPVVGSGANWCTFATWASRQAGQTIRGDDLRQAFQDRLRVSTELMSLLGIFARSVSGSRVGRDVDGFIRKVTAALDVDGAFRRSSDAVARGNRKVFEEIAREFARFLAMFGEDTAVDESKVAGFCSALRDGAPPSGQRCLRDAFATYARSRFEPDAALRAQMLYHANLLVGLHEQTRLQPEIAEAISSTLGDPAELRRHIRQIIVPSGWAGVVGFFSGLFGRRPPLDPILDRIVAELVRVLRQTITAELMTLRMPRGVVLRLGQDLAGSYPVGLASPSDPELLALLSRIDPTPGSPFDSGTRDWADFNDRMHFIAELFRLRHEDAAMFDAP
jgi:hypothetical protein